MIPEWVQPVECMVCGEALLDPVVIPGFGAMCVPCASGDVDGDEDEDL